MSFDEEMGRALLDIETASEKAIRGAALELFGAIVAQTPVGDPGQWKAVKEWQSVPGNTGNPPWLEGYVGGTARGAWQTRINAEPRGVPGSKGSPRPAQAAEAEIRMQSAKFTLADTIFFGNNVPYIRRLESGHSGQAPRGMVAINVNRFEQAIDAQARRNRV